jgi:hypothetical protein
MKVVAVNNSRSQPAAVETSSSSSSSGNFQKCA